MNNLKYYDYSLAYNFELFMPAEKKRAEVVPLPESPKRKAAKKRAGARAVAKKSSVFLIGIFILAMLCGNLFLRSQVTETQSKIENVNKKISEMESEETRLNVAIEKKLSYQNLEQQAYALGMRKLDKNQVTYIKTNSSNKAITSDGEQLAENN